jgi:hypothetical protein
MSHPLAIVRCIVKIDVQAVAASWMNGMPADQFALLRCPTVLPSYTRAEFGSQQTVKARHPIVGGGDFDQNSRRGNDGGAFCS